MDFGAVGLDGLVSSTDNKSDSNSTFSLATSDKPKWFGSGLQQNQQERPAAEGDWRGLKVAKTSEVDDFVTSKAMLFQHKSGGGVVGSNSLHHSDGHQNMLSFSSPNSQTVSFPYSSTATAAAYGRTTGYGSGGASMQGMVPGIRGPFTPLQWMELEQQALIYKYIIANAPIPSNLLIPIRKALDTAGFSNFPGGHLRHNTFGWGGFHLGYSGSSDPEPGRCRRTDGKKWRCSRDAVADQKYCERHMNRGRNRSRKPVEGQSGHSVLGGPTTTTKHMPMSMSSSTSSNGASTILGHLHHHQLGTSKPPTSSQLDRTYLNKQNLGEKFHDATGLSITKQHNPSEESACSEFGLVCSDSLLNPLHKSNSLVNCGDYGSSKDFNDLGKKSSSQHSLRQFMDDWPNTDRTQLSISIPSDFMSSTSSPTNERLAPSPLRLSRELEQTQMGLGTGTIINNQNARQENWDHPISWGTSLGGPLGEVLHSTNNSTGEIKNVSPLNLMTEGWDNSPRMALSPTGVLQKTTFGSVSNSSAGSSPRAENNLFGSASFPTL